LRPVVAAAPAILIAVQLQMLSALQKQQRK